MESSVVEFVRGQRSGGTHKTGVWNYVHNDCGYRNDNHCAYRRRVCDLPDSACSSEWSNLRSTNRLVTPTVVSAATEYTITAMKITGGTVTKTITLTVNPCAGDRSKVLFRIRADNYDYENSWKLFSGRGTLVASVS